MALTATANEQTIGDIIARLGMKDCVLLKQSFNRTNLFYDVRPKGTGKAVLVEIHEFIQTKHRDECGVIYCLSRNKCEEVAKELRDRFNLRAKHYHAQMSPNDKKTTQKEWQDGKCNIIVATVGDASFLASHRFTEPCPDRCRSLLGWVSTRLTSAS